MARHPFGPRARRRTRNRTYTILLAVLVISVVVAFYYGPFGKNKADTIDPTSDNDINVDTAAVDEPDAPYDNETIPEPVFAQEPVVEPKPVIAPEPEITQEPEVSQPTAFVPPVVQKEPELPKIAPEPTPGQTIEPNPEAAALIAKAETLLS